MYISDKIIEFIQKRGEARAIEIKREFGYSRVFVHRELAKLLKQGRVEKLGTPPRVFYSVSENTGRLNDTQILDADTHNFIELNYLYITPTGDILEGVNAFRFWCAKTKQDFVKTAGEYIKTLKRYYKLKKDYLIDGTYKLKNTFKELGLDKVFYLDFYSIERFGKTKLGQTLLYAKQSQNENLMNNLVREVKPKIINLIDKYQIDVIGFIPPTVKREVQFMNVLEMNLNLNTPKINIVKAKNKLLIPQKTLNKLDDRIQNAKKTIIVNDTRIFNNVLIVDDAVGSGATLNETALQTKRKKLCTGKIYGLAIVGSFKGFDVISEV